MASIRDLQGRSFILNSRGAVLPTRRLAVNDFRKITSLEAPATARVSSVAKAAE
jgi:hypothetical protein